MFDANVESNQRLIPPSISTSIMLNAFVMPIQQKKIQNDLTNTYSTYPAHCGDYRQPSTTTIGL